MKRFKLVGLACMAILALTVMASASASANLPLILPEARPVKFNVKSGAGEFLQVGAAFSNVKCKKDTGSGELTEAKLGTFKVKFEECSSPIAGTCTALKAGEAAGTIEVTGKFHTWYVLDPANTKVAGLVFLIDPVHFTCGIALAKVEGCVAGSITPVSKKVPTTEHYTVTIAQKEKDVQLITKVFNDTGTEEITCELKSAENEKAAAQGIEVTTEEVTGTVETELMA